MKTFRVYCLLFAGLFSCNFGLVFAKNVQLPVPQTPEDFYLDFDKRLDSETKKRFYDLKNREDVHVLGFGLESSIRNSLGLWNRESPIRKYYEKQGHRTSPERLSIDLLKGYWDYIHK